MLYYIKTKLHELFLYLAVKTEPEDTVIVPMTVEEYGDFLEFQEGLFIVYENEEELHEDFPNAVPAQSKYTLN